MIDDLTDDDVRSILTATGDTPAAAFRDDLRELLSGGTTNIAVTRRHGAGSVGSRRWWLPASVAAAAVLVVVGGLLALGRNGGDTSPADTPDDSASATTHEVNTTLQSLVGTQLVELDAPSDRVPTLTITDFSTVGSAGADLVIEAFDGCNTYTSNVRIVGDEVRETSNDWQTEDPCPVTPLPISAPDVITPLADGISIRAHDNGTEHAFRRLDTIAAVSSTADAVGSWTFEGNHVMTLFAEADGYTEAKIGDCDLTWRVEQPGRILLVADNGQDVTTCTPAPGVPEPLWTGITFGVDEAHRLGDQLLIATDGRVYRLRLDLTQIDSGTITPTPDDPASDGLFDRTWVAGDNPASRVPWLRFTSLSSVQGGIGVTQFDGCNSGSGTVQLDGNVVVNSLIGTTKVLCRDIRSVTPIADGTELRLDLGQPREQLTVTTRGASTRYVALESFDPISTPDDVAGTWTYKGSPFMTLSIGIADGSGGRSDARFGSCSTTWQVGEGGALVVDPSNDPSDPCSVSSITDDPLISQLLNGSNRTYRTGPTRLWIIGDDDNVLQLVLGDEPIDGANDPTSISFEVGSAFGYRAGDFVTADEALAHVSSLLGPPTHDTGWFDTTPDPTITDHEDCMGARTIRTLWWQDFSLSFFELQGTEQLWTWTVGDTRITRNGDRREPYLPDLADQSRLTSDTDIPIGIGSTTADLIDAYGNQARPQNTSPDLFDDGAVFWSVGDTGFQVLVRDDIVIGFGAQIYFC